MLYCKRREDRLFGNVSNFKIKETDDFMERSKKKWLTSLGPIPILRLQTATLPVILSSSF
jgi:hypothetical protein